MKRAKDNDIPETGINTSSSKTIFTTIRFIIREYTRADLEAWLDLLTHPEVAKYLPPYDSNKWTTIFYENLEIYRSQTGFARWAVEDKINNMLIGFAMLTPAREGLSGYELGYTVQLDYWGTGAGTEVCRGLVDYGFNKRSVQKICAITSIKNIASRRVLEKSGFEETGTVLIFGSELPLYEINNPDAFTS